VPFGLGIWEIVILAVVLMLLFGAKGLPSAARRLGSGVRELKDAVGEMDPRGILDPKDEPERAKPASPAPKPQAALPAAPPPEPEQGPAAAAPAEQEPEAEESAQAPR
jgi:sec-independent protein translocase protein TatA